MKIKEVLGQKMAVFTNVDKYGRTSETYLKLADAERLKRECDAVLRNYAGYLYPLHRAAMHDFLHNDIYNGKLNTDHAVIRAENFKRAGIPPLFTEDLESVSADGRPYPVLDEVILLGSGRYGQRIAGKAFKARKLQRDFTALVPECTPDDVIEFAKRAYDDRRVNMHLLRDLGFRIRNFTKASEENIPEFENNRQIALDYLRQCLYDFIPVKTEYPSIYDPKMNLDFLSTRNMWTTVFSFEDREKIFHEYVRRLHARDISREGIVMRRMRALFPEFDFPEQEDIQAFDVRRQYSNAIASGNYKSVPASILFDPIYAELKTDFISRLDYMFNRSVEDPEAFLGKINENLANELGLHPAFIHIPEVTTLINKYRRMVIEMMSDEQFLSHFPDARKVAGFGMYRYGFLNGVPVTKDPVHNYVVERFNSLA